MIERRLYTVDALTEDLGNHDHHLRAASEAEIERRIRKRYPEAVEAMVRPEEQSWLQILWSSGPVP